MAVFPAAIRRFPSRVDYTETIYAQHINDLQEEVTAIQKTLGTNPHVGALSGGGSRTYASVVDRLNRQGSSVVIEATATAPHAYSATGIPDGVSRLVWDSVTSTVNGVATTSSSVNVLPLVAGQFYSVAIQAYGNAPGSGNATLRVHLSRTLPSSQAAYLSSRTEDVPLINMTRAVTSGSPVGFSISDIPVGGFTSAYLSVVLSGIVAPNVHLVAVSLDDPTVLP